MKFLRIALIALVCAFGFAAPPPHAAYGPEFVGYKDNIRVDVDTACNVFAISTYDYDDYKQGRSFNYYGGEATYSPFYINPPSGSYYIIIDTGGGSIEGIRASVQIIHRY